MRSRSPLTAVEKPTVSCTVSSTLPNACDNGSHRYCRSSMVSRSVARVAVPV